MDSQKVAFVAVAAGYLAVTTAESVLAPVFPQLEDDLGFGTGLAGLAFGVLAASIATGNLAGGVLLGRRGPRLGAVLGLAVAAVGSFATTAGQNAPVVLGSQVVLGLGVGLFFPSGLTAIAGLTRRRRGLAIGFFGVAFSGGLALGGGFAALGGAFGWRLSFVLAGCLAAATAASIALLRLPRLPVAAPSGQRPPLRQVLTMPLAVGGVASASQYGTVAFLPLFAVQAWGLSPTVAALLITVARIVSIPAKLLSGNASDSAGALRVARRLAIALTVLGIWWTLVPGAGLAAWAAVLFAALVSGLGPLANVLALDGLVERAELLGLLRSCQIGIGGATGAVLGGVAELVGLRPSLVVTAALIPASLLLLGRAGLRVRSRPLRD